MLFLASFYFFFSVSGVRSLFAVLLVDDALLLICIKWSIIDLFLKLLMRTKAEFVS